MKIKNILAILSISICSLSFAQGAPTPICIGESISLESVILNENRTINIYLPPGYNQNDSITYPTVYVLDGGVEEDFIHISGLIRFNTQPWIDRFPNSIVVGIENVNRRRDFTFDVPNLDFLDKVGFDKKYFPEYGQSTKYIKFLKDEVIPYMERTYKGNGNRTVIGESLAGLLEVDILRTNPELFSNYIIISPSLWWGSTKFLNKESLALLTKINSKHKIYIGVPNKDEDVMMYNDALQLYDNLKKNQNLEVHWDYLQDELHSTVIHQAVNNALRKLYTKTAFSK